MAPEENKTTRDQVDDRGKCMNKTVWPEFSCVLLSIVSLHILLGIEPNNASYVCVKGKICI